VNVILSLKAISYDYDMMHK